VSNNHNAAEVFRLAESLRLVEQGRDEAIRGREAGLEQIKKLQEELTLAHRTSEGYKATIADLRSELVQTERSLERQSGQLHTARKDANALVEAAQEQGMIRRAQFTVAGLIVSLLAGAVMFFVGRWAR
jgi:chromosome segregation ATPase